MKKIVLISILALALLLAACGAQPQTAQPSEDQSQTAEPTAEKDPIAPFRILADYSKKLGDRFNIKAAFMEGKVLSESEIAEMAELPSKGALYSKVLGTMIAPITGLAVCLGQILEQKGGSIESAEAAE